MGRGCKGRRAKGQEEETLLPELPATSALERREREEEKEEEEEGERDSEGETRAPAEGGVWLKPDPRLSSGRLRGQDGWEKLEADSGSHEGPSDSPRPFPSYISGN